MENITKDIFFEFCDGERLWDASKLEREVPEFSDCLRNTVLVWPPCAFIWILSPFFVVYIYKCKKYMPLPFSVINISKGVVSLILACLMALQLIFQEHDGYGCHRNKTIPAAAYTASGLKFATFILTVILQQIQRRRGIKTSAVPFVFWVLLISCEAFSLYSHINKQIICEENIVFYVYYALMVVQLCLHCISERHVTHGYHEMDDQNQCPEEDASILNRILFQWFTSVVWKSFRKKIVVNSFWNPPPRLKSSLLGPLLEDAWKDEVRRCQALRRLANIRERYENGRAHVQSETSFLKSTSEKSNLLNGAKQPSYMAVDDEDVSFRPNLFRTIARVFWRDWVEATTFMGIGELLWMVQPIVLRFIIDMIEEKGENSVIVAEWKGYLYSLLLFVVLSLNSILFHVSFHHITALGLKVKTALICLIYKKALTMKRSGTKTTTVGEIVNLMSVDCQRIQDAFTFSFYIVLAVIIVAVAAIMFWDIMGIAFLGGLGIILIIFPIMGGIALKQYVLQKELLYLKGGRIKILNEVVSGMKVLKMYAWEPSFITKIRSIRQEEIDRLRKYATLASISLVFAVHSPFMINFVLFLIYVLTSSTHSLGASEAFTTLSLVNIIRYPIALCPFLINGLVQASVSINRIQEYLRTEDVKTDNVNFVKTADYAVNMENGNFAWNTENAIPAMRDLNFRVNDGELVAVVGQVGSGKSSLISACLGDMEKLSGSVTIKGKIAYVPQEAWIQNMTLRDNILFGKEHNKKKYDRVLEACALLPDLKILAGGDMTEIGEKGINISGGQKQRVSLARSVYNNADVYFLDDPLSAVDSHVGKHLFKHVIGNQGLLRNKTRILVTHGVHWLPMVDRIIVLTDGAVTETGTYEELVSHDGPFAQFLNQHLQQDSDDEEELDPEVREMKQKVRSGIEDLKSDGGLTSEDDTLSPMVRRRRRSDRQVENHVREARIQRISESSHVTGREFTATATDHSRLTVEETSEDGAIKLSVLLSYMKAMGYMLVVIVFVCICGFQGVNIFSNFWLTYWTEDTLLKNVTLSQTPEYEQKYLYYLLMYLLMGVIQGILVFTGFYLALTRMVKASKILHNRMLESILRSPMSFFDTTPIGRIMNRFSSDIDIMDNKLPESFRLWTIMVFSTIAVVVVVSITTPIFIAAIIPIAIFYVLFVKFYLPTARTMRRTESICRSPIYNHFSETITGACVIRAYKCGFRFVEESRKRIDKNIKFYFAANTGSRWIGIRLELLGNLIVLLATIFVLLSDDVNGAQTGLSISYAVQITITMNLVVFAVSEMEMNVVSAERVTEYTDLPPEAGWVFDRFRPPRDWPSTGRIEFRNYTTRYREGLDLVLKGINCAIQNGEKVGIVGRTGAGKSSLTLCLFRLIEAAGGSIVIDGIDIATMGLHDLRNKLTILPQDPVLFSGSLRNNLDPFGRYGDEAIWYALECAHLKDFVTNLEEGLLYECGESGQNLSVGQRQLVCLARTLLHKTKVLILDEATAAVDMETDDLIQDTIRTQFKDCTIITVAHRLNTILDYDRVMVLDAGLIKEFDNPQKLLQDPNGVFYSMAKNAKLV